MTTNEITAVAVTPGGRHAVSGSRDKTLKVWDLDTGAVVRTLEGHADRVAGVAVTAGGRRAVSASWDKTLKVWDLETGSVVHTLEGHTGAVWGVAAMPDGRQAVSASSDETLKVWDLERGEVLRTLEGHTAGVRSVAVTPDGRGVASAAGDGTLKVWDLKRGALVHTLEGHTAGVTDVAVTPDGRRAVSAAGDWTLKVWDLATGVLIHTLRGHTAGVTGVATMPDGKGAVSAAGDGTLKVWDLETGATLRTLEGHSGAVYDVAVTPEGRRAVSASHDGTLKVWDLETGAFVRTLESRAEPVYDTEVMPDERRVAADQPPAPVKDAQFTAYAPQAIEPRVWHPVYVYAHRSEPFQVDGVTRDPVKEVQEAAERATRRESTAYAAVTGDSTGAILPDDEITLVLTFQQMQVSPPSHSFRWEDTTTFVRRDFFINAGQELAGQQVAGTLVVLRGVLVIASASIVLKVAGRGDEQGVERTRIPISRKKVFPSYSHKDSGIVESVLDAVRLLGTEYLQDVEKLRSGEVWQERIQELIEEADHFQLFWSWRSMESPYVEQEWKYAVSLGRPDGFILPCYWEHPRPERPGLPPPELDRFHFQLFRAAAPATSARGDGDANLLQEPKQRRDIRERLGRKTAPTLAQKAEEGSVVPPPPALGGPAPPPDFVGGAAFKRGAPAQREVRVVVDEQAVASAHEGESRSIFGKAKLRVRLRDMRKRLGRKSARPRAQKAEEGTAARPLPGPRSGPFGGTTLGTPAQQEVQIIVIDQEAIAEAREAMSRRISKQAQLRLRLEQEARERAEAQEAAHDREREVAAIYAPQRKGRALRLAVTSVVILALVGVAVLTWMAVR